MNCAVIALFPIAAMFLINRFDQDSTIGQIFGQASDANVLVKINGRSTVRDFNFNTM